MKNFMVSWSLRVTRAQAFQDRALKLWDPLSRINHQIPHYCMREITLQSSTITALNSLLTIKKRFPNMSTLSKESDHQKMRSWSTRWSCSRRSIQARTSATKKGFWRMWCQRTWRGQREQLRRRYKLTIWKMKRSCSMCRIVTWEESRSCLKKRRKPYQNG
jgi:hypothetical protein